MVELDPVQLIKDVLKKHNLKHKDLAQRLGVHPTTIGNWLSSIRNPSAANISVLQELLADKAPKLSLAEQIKQARLKMSWSVPKLAEKSGVSIPSINNIESGKNLNPRQDTVNALFKALSIDQKKKPKEVEVPGIGTFTDFDPHIPAELPSVPGVYVFYDISKRPIYIGQSQNIAKRIKNYKDIYWFRYPLVYSAAYVEVKEAKLRNQIETTLIKFLKSNAVLNDRKVDR